MPDNSADLDQIAYDGPLGALYTKEKTLFQLWAPTASQVDLVIFEGYYGPVREKIAMTYSASDHIYCCELAGDQNQLTYRYLLTFSDGTCAESVDPYSRAVTVNGRRSVVVDLSKTNPRGWSKRMPPYSPEEPIIIYEMSVRDFTKSSTSQVRHPGKFLGLCEEGTRSVKGQATGLSYLKSLGISHVQVMPVFDFQSVDETLEDPFEYNWGYDPQNYNVPEGSYASDPYDPTCRILELKQMIQALHQAGIRVIMDVVYNHVYQIETHPFHRTVPGYYFRYDESGQLTNGSGVGNDTASEHRMMRKYILDSVTYWAQEYHIDGFRFDLMGLHDIETMKAIRQALDQIDPTILMLGEGWNMPTPFGQEQAANLGNACQMPRIAHFNDGFREAVKGNDFNPEAKGFVNGAYFMEEKLAHNFLSHYQWGTFLAPNQVIQYSEAHDNYTLYDRLIQANPLLSPEVIIRQQELALSLTILSQGIPFIHSGQEFLRTKGGIRDSYNQSDAINQIDWERAEQYSETVQFVRDLIQLRKQEPLLCQSSIQSIQSSARINQASERILVINYQGRDYDLLLIFNGDHNQDTLSVEEGIYQLILSGRSVDLTGVNPLQGLSEVKIEAYSTTVLKRWKT